MVNRNQPNQKRVVVTGLGVVSSVGIGWQDFWKNLLAGKSGISEVTAFDTSKHDIHLAGEVKGFKANDFISHNRLKGLPRASQFAITASLMALEDAGVVADALLGRDIGVCIGTTVGEIQVSEQFTKHTIVQKEAIVPVRALMSPPNSIANNVSQFFKLRGPSIVIGNACAASNFSIGNAYDLIRTGLLDCVLVGGVDVLSRIAFTGFVRMYAMSPDKCRPFDKERKGMMLGEGCGIIVLESMECALKRKANIYAEMLGYGVSCDANHMTRPLVNSVEKAIRRSLANSGLDGAGVDYISTHGTGTQENDKSECHALRNIFGDMLSNIPASSIKSMLGHTMGGAAVLEAIACCLTIKDSHIPPTINYQEPDPECQIDCVPNKSRQHIVNIAMNNSLAFGGNNCCLMIGRM